MLRKRYLELDLFRGLAILMMVLFHILFDLNMYGVTHLPLFSHPFWMVYRETISFLFLGLVGFCLYLEHQNGIRWKAFGRRTLRIAVGAFLVSIGTYIFDPHHFIYFGILHFIVAGSLVALAFLHKPRLSLILGIYILAFGYIGHINDPRHSLPYLGWVGFGTSAMQTLECFPFIPFFGYVLMGLALAAQTLSRNKDYLFVKIPPQGDQSWLRFLSFLGKHPLAIYLVHQPILIGIIHLATHGINRVY